jgi:DNA-binding transcriptional ArsR family regulator
MLHTQPLRVVPDSPVENIQPDGFYQIPNSMAIKAIRAKLTAADWALWSYLQMIDPFGEYQEQQKNKHPFDLLRVSEIAKAIEISEKQVNRSLKRLRDTELLPEWIVLKDINYSDTERRIRDRLKAEAGGQVEVVTAVGRIDLLTATELIEVKDIKDWKNALGQTLAYAAFFPTHRKRIHLFGRSDLAKLVLAQATCSEFGITVTFEEVQP